MESQDKKSLENHRKIEPVTHKTPYKSLIGNMVYNDIIFLLYHNYI